MNRLGRQKVARVAVTDLPQPRRARLRTAASGRSGRKADEWKAARMQRIVVAAKAGADQPWLADAAAQIAQETGAEVDVVSVDGLELEALSTVPRSELAALAQEAVDRAVARL